MKILRFTADRRTVAFMIVTTAILAAQWSWDWNWQFGLDLATFAHFSLFLAGCFMAITVCTMTHNHCHMPVWNSKWMNYFQDYWLTLFYGYPIYAWIPTHNRNHHVLNNKPGDASLTYRYSEKNNLLTLLSYPTISGFFQQKLNFQFISGLWKKDRARALYYLSQVVLLVAFDAAAFAINWKKALFFVFIPQQVSLNVVLIFNYIQHVHTDELSRWNHSRNFLNPMLNFFLFNNGYHTIHHEKPLLHWSLNAQQHDRIVAPNINPILNERSMWGFLGRVYILGLFCDRFRTHSMRLARIAKEMAGLPSRTGHARTVIMTSPN